MFILERACFQAFLIVLVFYFYVCISQDYHVYFQFYKSLSLNICCNGQHLFFLQKRVAGATLKNRGYCVMARTKITPPEGLLSDLEYTSVIVSYSNGIDSTGALYWALKHFPKEKIPPVRLKILKAAFYKAKSISIDKFEPDKALIYVAL